MGLADMDKLAIGLWEGSRSIQRATLAFVKQGQHDCDYCSQSVRTDSGRVRRNLG